ncbi:MAG: phosphoenolpyruvate--protein phosphotransferase [Candidatus Algichlamydia australiensis]|nr:phosphoenolpyruvate--protein phosphotransferase [Chlamydiales bacterium]
MPSQEGVKQTSQEIILKGVSISPGIAWGTLHRLLPLAPEPGTTITGAQVETEIARFRKAVASSRRDLKNLQGNMREKEEIFTILDTHIKMLDDPKITRKVEERIRGSLLGKETVFRQVVGEIEKRFSAMSSSIFRERFLDVKDLSRRILGHLREKRINFTKTPKKNKIIWSEELMPSDIVEEEILGYVSHLGGRTSHAALLARARGVPFISGIELEKEHDGKEIFLDGEEGVVVINPTEERKQSKKGRKKTDYFPPNEEIKIFANIDSLENLHLLAKAPIHGIGLVRTEFLFPPSELFSVSVQEQADVYEKIIEAANGMPVNFRIFDVGADKRNGIFEPNPALGMRGIRYHLHFSQFFRRQLSALFSAAKEELRIMLPMIADLEELRLAKKIIFEVQKELQYKGLLQIGVMIELPSSAILADLIAQECDFLSIGSNDLTQYTLACDRLSPYVAYSPIHESLLRLFKMIIEKAGDVPVCLCGEIASDLEHRKTLIEVGIKSFSCSIARMEGLE